MNERSNVQTFQRSNVTPSGEEALRAAVRRFRQSPEGVPLRIRLATALIDRCSAEDLRALCFRLGIDYDNLNGTGKAAKARELVLYYERRDALEALVDALCQTRPDIAL
ncbi:MAG: hypothetical protein JXC32_05720 [Anaerolineae bacterium]|nr:hypothetical protein [Anaerolineae bacterium]